MDREEQYMVRARVGETNRAVTVTVRRRMNDHGTMTVEVNETNATRHLVEYATPDLRRALAALPVGASVPLMMESAGSRGNVWRATSMTSELDPERTVRTPY